MKTRVLDTWPVLEWIKGREPTASMFLDLLAEAETGSAYLLMSAINVGEVFYFLRKNGAPDVSDWWREALTTMPVTVSTPSLDDIWAAAVLKADHRIAYADAFAAALAQKHCCPLLTGDPEFRAIAGLEVDWIGRP